MKTFFCLICRLLVFFTAFSILSNGCTKDIKADIEQIKSDLSEQNAKIEALQKNLAIKSLTFDSASGTYSVIFEDGQTLAIPDTFLSDIQDTGEGWLFIFSNGTEIECVKQVYPARLINFGFKSKDNPRILISDCYSYITPEGNVECHIPYIVDSKELTPVFEYEGINVTADGAEVISGETRIDFKAPVTLDVTAESGDKMTYMVYVTAFTGLPIVYIETEDKADIVTKDTKLNCTVRIVEDVRTKASGDVFEAVGTIKGRGNSTWKLPKKPYKIKFESKQSVLGMPKDKEWVLLANYTDKTQIRNELGFFMGRTLSGLDYTCRTHYVEVILNGEYLGTYQLGEHQKISSDRVNVGDEGYLLEIDSRASSEDDARYFTVSHIGQPINIKDPEVEYDTDQFNIAKDFVKKVDQALYSNSFTDPVKGYAQYMDVDSFVDWYLINEIAKNNDSIFFSSCYMHFQPGGKLIMGPIWDFDIAFGNIDYSDCSEPDGLWVKRKVGWYKKLFEDPAFVEKVKTRFNYYYDNLDLIMNEINDCAQYLQYSAVENNYKWGTLYTYTWPNNVVLGSYENEVRYLKTWLQTRMNYLKEYFETL